MPKPKIGASLLLVLVLTSGASPARSETVDCTPVTTLPASIATSGVYCLTGDLGTTMTSGSAINVTDVGNIVRNNLVVGTGGSTSGGQSNVDAVGIFVGGDGPRVLNNDVINTFKQGSGTATGIVFAATNDGLAVINRITSSDLGIDFQIGSTGKYRDTLTFGVTTPFHGGTPVGTNS